MKIIHYCIALCFIFDLYAQGGDIDNQLRGNQVQLDRVKDEINQLRKDITKTNIQTSSTLEQIKVIDHEIALLNRSKKLLEKETLLLGDRINLIHDQLEISRRKLKSLKDQYAARVVHLYKYGKIQNIELLLGASSINQMMVRYKYLKFFNDQEKLVLKNINMRIAEIEKLERELSLDYQKQRLSLQNKNTQQQKYLARKKDKKQLVSRLKLNNVNLNKQLKTAEQEYQKLYQLIVALERKRKKRADSGDTPIDYALNLKDFKKNKGKLPWPVKGAVIHQFGKQRNQALKTTINYTGIDIKAQSGAEVRAVFVGVVSMITYLSGYGNTIILDHGEGYYTVYSHLDEFFVEPDALIEAGQVIGLVGDSGSLEGSKLHFAVFANQKTENPQHWLR
jgi:septal ring factor EnvC (AmiA/AmiB activator)